MTRHDRVFCDLCDAHIGQLFNQPAQSVDLLVDQTMAPAFAVCPDCWDASVIVVDDTVVHSIRGDW
ncbi:hypothetical protein [Stutzerimonas chloritidismutans]|uniref:Small CPxCG-related zinc finger protein n=1 Tax=Stutzerimonas chloritidismutans TaxID=203192 RepID=A0ABU9MCI5_STUCH|tara:strand:+ start:114 stop:311 length:198 start_codon:yes stop_codon:yes gene_type:complete